MRDHRAFFFAINIGVFRCQHGKSSPTALGPLHLLEPMFSLADNSSPPYNIDRKITLAEFDESACLLDSCKTLFSIFGKQRFITRSIRISYIKHCQSKRSIQAILELAK